MFSLINNILQALNDGKLVGDIYCDLTKAFDSVKMQNAKKDFYGIRVYFLN
jgi:hypothetical protein